MDAAAPSAATPAAGTRGHRPRPPTTSPPAYSRQGPAKRLTRLQPTPGRVRIQGVTRPPKPVRHGWLKQALSAVLAALAAAPPGRDPPAHRACWESGCPGRGVQGPRPAHRPPRRRLLSLDQLAGHPTPALVEWLVRPGLGPLDTPVAGRGLQMPEAVQRLSKRRAGQGASPADPPPMIPGWAATARGWKAPPPPLVWAGQRTQRRPRA